MKKQLFLMAVLAMLCSAAGAQTDYLQFGVLNITPKIDKVDLFKKGILAHNKKYHAAAPYKANVAAIITGPNSGDFVWVMGPTTWTQLDGAPGEGEHNLDWDKNVTPYCESIGEYSYWRDYKDARYDAEGSATFKKSSMRANRVYPGQMDRYLEQMKKVAEVYKKKKYTGSFSVATIVGATTGINAVSFSSFAKWSWFDRGTVFSKDFEEVHGAGTWVRFLEEIDLCVDPSSTYTELSESIE
ncbi:MAG: hypothetical protein JNM78_08650 [Cyclobacteriaceae bacterium]|nr:hypothetical protein [Cyclobacteriaceae bacterium]